MMNRLVDRLASWTGLTGDFYAGTIQRVMADGVLRPDMRVLVVCGGERDREALLACGLQDVTISNLDPRMQGDEFAPFHWSFQDAENLSYGDGSFDFVIAHSGLHHCYSPHRALCEMHRVARMGLIVFEPHDGRLVRLGVRFDFGQEYETAAVFDNGMAFGGVRNTAIPNFVYRWTEAEVKKAIQSYSPIGPHRYVFYYATRIPWSRLRLLKNRLLVGAVVVSLPVVRIVCALFPKVSNNFAFLVVKPRVPDDLYPWLRLADGAVALNEAWLVARYRQR